MPDNLQTETAPSIVPLVEGIISDAQRLMRQEVALARTEIEQEWNKTKAATAALGAGIVIAALSGIFFCQMLVYLLNWLTELPLWGCFGIVGGLFALLGAIMIYSGKHQVEGIHFVPQQTAETMKENVRWLKNQT